jgi:hypothetical protein
VVGGLYRQRIVDILLARPDGMPIGDLIEQVYAVRPDGSPPSATQCIAVMVYQANKQLQRQGYRIVSTKGRGARYRVVTYANTIGQPARITHAGHLERAQPAGAAREH